MDGSGAASIQACLDAQILAVVKLTFAFLIVTSMRWCQMYWHLKRCREQALGV
jgi:hypothetical protein